MERLVIPTIVEPLRQDWSDVQAAALVLDRSGKTAEAIAVIAEFRRRLCSIEILDPACGSGNFLYVTLEHLKRLEAEINDALESLGETQQALRETGLTVDPHQLKGIELNPRAAAITDLVPLMANSGYHHIPIVDSDARFVGIVTQSDLVAALYQSRLAEV